MKLLLLVMLVAGCSAQSALWVANTTVPVQIAKSNFSAICVISGLSVSNTTVFQWINGSSISPSDRYIITIGPIEGQTLDSLLVGDELVSNWTKSSEADAVWSSAVNASGWYAQITINSVKKDEVGGLRCANVTTIPLDSYAYVAMGVGMKESKNVIQGDEYCLTCEAYGSPRPETIYWYKNSELLVPSSRIQLSGNNKTANATLKFVPVEFEDAADYTCVSQNVYGDNGQNVTMTLNVKDRWAALWPFLGIVAEVIILCTIILLYEKRQQANLAAEEDEKDQSLMNDGGANEKEDRDGLANGGGGDDVRQRPIIKS